MQNVNISMWTCTEQKYATITSLSDDEAQVKFKGKMGQLKIFCFTFVPSTHTEKPVYLFCRFSHQQMEEIEVVLN